MTVETDLSDAATASVRVPGDILQLVRQSYDTRQKALDWLLALSVAGALVWAFQDELKAWIWPANLPPDAGRDATPQPNQDVAGAYPFYGRGPDRLSYNLPPSRSLQYGRVQSAVGLPSNPSAPPFLYGGPTSCP